MVLGILSVMVIMAVAFAIAMRTERVAAGNYADSVRARQLVHVGLARALDDLAVKLGTNGLGSAGGLVYPPWTVTNSFTNAYTNTSSNVYLLSTTKANEATNFVPRALWAVATNQDFNNAKNHWLPVDSLVYTNYAGFSYVAESNRMGRVKYLILNCSGLLDANFVGGVTRGLGTNPMEIAVDLLGELPVAFTNQRDTTDVRYETLEELAALYNVTPANFCVYSRALPGYWSTNWNCVATQVNLSGTEDDMPVGSDRWRAITNAFYLAGFSGSEAGVLYRNLIDYIDQDYHPDLDTTCVEPVPMINEMVFSNNVTCPSGTNWIVNCGVSFELWYPFVSGGGLYSFTANVAFVSSVPGVGTLWVGGKQNNCALSPVHPFDVINFNVSTNYSLNPLTFNFSIGAAVVMSGTNELDKLNPCLVLPGMLQNRTIGWECLDPRFNHYPNNPDLWQQASLITLSNVNQWTSSYLASPTNTGDTNTEMYVANTSLQSVAELGYLVYSSNAPWHTVKLYGANLRRVLDVFGLSTNTSDIFITNTAVYRGLVNCNSNVATDATAAVFAGMPVDQYPGGPVLHSVDMTEARAFTANIFAGGLFTNLSDVGRNLNDFSFPVGATELEREAYFRNSINLLNVRQNLFTIIIEAQVASGGNIPRHPVKQRAVALVWRDPYTGEMFVRSLKWLKN